jgi:SMODS-associating 2TM, beta-strand rich effector domain
MDDAGVYMSHARTVRLTALAVVIIYSGALAVSGVSPSPHLQQSLAYLPTVVGMLVLAFERWAWRWFGVNRLFSRPDLVGTWHVTLQPSDESHIPDTRRGTRHAFMVVQQTFWTVQLTQVSAESRSESTTATFRKTDGARHQRLSFLYDNIPQQKFQPGSPRHEGACTVNIADYRPSSMDGIYFTNRLTCGDMRLTKASNHAVALPYDDLREQLPTP